MIQPLYFQIAGGLLIVLALSHAWFPRRFQWRRDTAAMSPLNRQMFYVHSFFIALVVFLNGVLFLGWSHLLMSPEPMAKVLLTGIGIFWSSRLAVQLFVYDRRLWSGNPSNTLIHVAFTCFWAFLTCISFIPVLRV